ncbi:2-polyprenyl-6-methoxyphenol hydroxylase [Streptomyces sp. TLI_053]|uniref:FAD-dependent oxidoreductase n=1 Tax=Streptomyces sp. TLI_053 TaxID=1855352 RepID=UPI00087C91B6|nr:FAD-dependent monooxygenase [Streptomyces sp. TLI_053]SDS71903.1 2-polyprenyl-6-methoxyphenol hydroxylase [Streptomyces sp. TLI_053]
MAEADHGTPAPGKNARTDAGKRTNPDRTGPGWGRAVVIGGGYAGLLAARVLADHFTEVLVLERDTLDRTTGAHPSAPQSYHAHAMMARGARTLELLFPGLRAELEQLGAPVYDYGERISFLLPTGFAVRATTGVRIQSFTRDELERRIRGRVLDLAPVRLLGGARVSGLGRGPDGRIDQVRYWTGAGGKQAVSADLVVDASGRTTSIDDWLGEAGLPVSAKSTVKARITYTTMVFDRTPEEKDYDLAYQMTFAPAVRRGGAMLAVEHGRWVCSLFGFEQHPPTDPDGFLDYARSLDNPRLAEQIARRGRHDALHRYTNPGSVWRLHHRNPGWPEGLIAIGDALCVFNPVYGQGLTVPAIEAEALGALLRRRSTGTGPPGLSREYLRTAAGIIKAPWSLSTTSDLMWNPTGRPLAARFAHWYNQQVFGLARHDADVWTRFVKVVNMTAPSSLLMRPSVLAKIARQALTRRPDPPAADGPPAHA